MITYWPYLAALLAAAILFKYLRFLTEIVATNVIPFLRRATQDPHNTTAGSKRRRGEKENEDAAKTWREARLILWAFLGLLLIFCLFLGGILPPRPRLTAADRTVLVHYEAMRHALAHEQLEDARRAAQALAAVPDAKQIFAGPAQKVARGETLDVARREFVPLSEAIVAVARGRSGYFVMHCVEKGCPEPCENCPMGHYSPWIQVSREVENPYMGLKHIKCGIVSPNQSAL